jgi:CheY-like chemotaxis protein
LDLQPQKSASVLLVEDDVVLRFTVADYLRDSGFEVWEAESADEAMFVLTSVPEIDVIFSDVVMPGAKDGFDLAEWVNRNCPSTPIILASGFPGAHRLGNQRQPVLTKPYALSWVEQKITEALHPDRR